jgi:hypothetical protein
MGIESLLPCYQDLTTEPCLEPDEFSPHHCILNLYEELNELDCIGETFDMFMATRNAQNVKVEIKDREYFRRVKHE